MILPATYQFEVGPPSLPSCHTFPQLPIKHLWPFIARLLCDPYLLLLQSSSWGVCTQKCHQKTEPLNRSLHLKVGSCCEELWVLGMRQVGCTSLAWNNSTPIYFTTSFLICKGLCRWFLSALDLQYSILEFHCVQDGKNNKTIFLPMKRLSQKAMYPFPKCPASEQIYKLLFRRACERAFIFQKLWPCIKSHINTCNLPLEGQGTENSKNIGRKQYPLLPLHL